MATTMNQTQSLPETIATALGRGKSRKEIVKILCNSGINPADANAMVEYAATNHRAAVRKGALKQIGVGIILLVIGIAITSGTYAAATSGNEGGFYIISYGPMIYGAIGILRGLFKLATA